MKNLNGQVSCHIDEHAVPNSKVGELQYTTSIPTSLHQYHDFGQAAALIQPIDKSVSKFINFQKKKQVSQTKRCPTTC